MPKRPRAHQIEDLSKTAFRRVIPSNWVVRNKEQDYGVDQEVEIFDENQNSTGYIFFAQLRATDSVSNSVKFKISIEQLKYFYSLQLPTLLVRYSVQDDRIFARWHFNVKVTPKEQNQKSMTFNFFPSEEWQESTPHHIYETLRDLQALRNSNASTVVVLKVEDSGVTPGELFKVKKALDEIYESVSCITFDETAQNAVILRVAISPIQLKIHAGAVFSTSFEVETFDVTVVQSAVTYSIAIILGTFSLTVQTQQIASWILEKELKLSSKELVYQTICRLNLSPEIAVRIAVLNGLHESSDFYCISFVHWLLTLPEHLKNFKTTEFFLSAHLERMLATNKTEAAAAAYYSIANQLSGGGQKIRAFRYFNRARKLLPDYLKREYFLKEIGGALFLSRKYRCAALAYEQAHVVNSDVKIKFNLADALFFCGRILEAQTYFLECKELGKFLADDELELKLFMCNQLLNGNSSSNLSVNTLESNQQITQLFEREIVATVEDWANIISVDAFSEVANYNWASFQFNLQNFEKALLGYLICGFRQPNDELAWTNALSSAMSMKSFDLMAWVVSTSTRLCGRQAYDSFRVQLESQGTQQQHEQLREALDDLFEKVRYVNDSNDQSDVVFRDVFTGNPLG